jgi:tetratricopeptide (TPR) repeat protein
MKKADIYKLMAICLFATALLSLHFSVVSAAVAADTIISKGNRYYMNRQYDKAAGCYAEVLALGYESGELFYNLGNACYKQDKLAKAILYYEKALLFKPGDEDIRQNLALANTRIIDKIDSIPDFFLKRWIRFIQGLLSPNQWAVLNIVLFVMALVGFTLFAVSNRFTTKKAGFSLGVAFILIFIAGLILMFGRMQKIQQHNNAIIMVPSVNARSSPDEQSTNVFVLHEGTKVMLTDSVQNWKEIRIANGNKGWVPREALESI